MAVLYPIIWVSNDEIANLISPYAGAFCDRFFAYLRAQGYLGSADDMLYAFLGDLGYTGTIEERMRQWESVGFVTVAAEGSGIISFTVELDAFGTKRLHKSAAATATFSVFVDAAADSIAAGASGNIALSVALQAAAQRTRQASATISFSITSTASGSKGLIPAVIYDGAVGDYMLHTSGPTGAADGADFSFVWAGEFTSDGSQMILLDIPGTVPVQIVRNTDNTIDFVGGTSGAVFANSTAAVAASTGFLAVMASATGTTSRLRVVHAGGIIDGTNAPGSATNLDLTANWYLGARDSSGLTDFLDATTSMWWIDNSYIDFDDSDNVEQFWDTTADLLRDPGSDGSNPVDGAFSPLICHVSNAASHIVNVGTGGDADTATTFTDGTTPGAYSADFSGADPAIAILETATAWWENDYAGNTKSGTVQTWADKTANANNPTQGTAGNRPTDGGAYADFDGSDDSLQIVAANATADLERSFQSPGATFCVVCAPDSDGESDLGAIWDHNISENFRTVTESGGSLNFRLQTRYQFTNGLVVSTSAYAVGAVHIIFIRLNKSSGNADQVWNIDGPSNLTIAGGGLTQTTANSGSAFAPGTNLTIGNMEFGAGNYDGKMHAMVWWPSKISDADVDTVGTYLATKYSGTWA